MTKIKEDLDNQMIGGDKHQASRVLDQVQNVHQIMKEMLMDLNNISEQMMMGNGVVGGGDEEVGKVGHGSSRRQIYHWGCKTHNLPQDFEIPRMTLGALITCWYCGDRRDRVPPLRFVRAYDLPHKRNTGV